jgi:IS30 family transposase
MRRISIIAVSMIFFTVPLWGQESQELPKKIEKKEGHYEYNGKVLRVPKECEKIILSINDKEATDHLKKAMLWQNNMMMVNLGGAVITTHFLVRKILWDEGSYITPIITFSTTVGVMVLFAKPLNKEWDKAIERYNEALKEKWGVSSQYLPEDKKLEVNFRYSF